MTASLSGKKFLVTGASRGIGEGVARLLVERGASVIGTYNTGKSESEALLHDLGSALTMLHVDLADPNSLSDFLRLFTEIERIDGLVNNAGVIDFQLWGDFTIESWRSVFAVNVDAPVALIHGLRDKLPQGGAVVNIASTDGYTGSFGSISYSASKAALINVTKSLGNLLGDDGVRVNAVAPGWIDTGMSTDASYAAAQFTPLGRNGTPADVAGLVAFLLGDEASYITGATFTIDGGYTNVDTIMKQEYADLTNDDPAGSTDA